jgi:hypothetical protein
MMTLLASRVFISMLARLDHIFIKSPLESQQNPFLLLK